MVKLLLFGSSKYASKISIDSRYNCTYLFKRITVLNFFNLKIQYIFLFILHLFIKNLK